MSLLYDPSGLNEDNRSVFDQFRYTEKTLITALKRFERQIRTQNEGLISLCDNEHVSLDLVCEIKDQICLLIREFEQSFDNYLDVLGELDFITDFDVDNLERNKNRFINDVKTQVYAIKASIMPIERNFQSNPDFGSNTTLGYTHANLPAIDIPGFSGENRDKFNEFITLFKSIIDSRPDLSDTTKLIYLKSKLTGGASRVISSLAITDENYAKAKDLLIQEYDDPLLRIASLIDQVSFFDCSPNLPKVLLDKFVHVRSVVFELQTLGIDIFENYSASTIIARILISRSPQYFCKLLQQKLQTIYPTLPQIFDNFSQLLRQLPSYTAHENQRYSYESKKAANQACHAVTKIGKTDSVSQPRNVRIETLADFSKRPSNNSCCFCSSTEHSATKCNVYMNHKARVKRLQELKRCIRCMREGHIAHNCRRQFTYPCVKCKSLDHISPLCNVNSEDHHSPKRVSAQIHNANQGSTANLTVPNLKFDLKNSTQVSGNNTIVSAQTHSNDDHNILPLMKITVNTERGLREGIILVDTGSEQTFLDSELLNVTHKKGAPCRIHTIAGEKTLYTGQGSVPCRLGSSQDNIEINAIVAHNFEIPMNNRKLRSVLRHMNNQGLTTALDPEMNLQWDNTIICGVLGADNIHILGDMYLRNFAGMFTFQTAFGNMPFGSINVKKLTSHRE